MLVLFYCEKCLFDGNESFYLTPFFLVSSKKPRNISGGEIIHHTPKIIIYQHTNWRWMGWMGAKCMSMMMMIMMTISDIECFCSECQIHGRKRVRYSKMLDTLIYKSCDAWKFICVNKMQENVFSFRRIFTDYDNSKI